ncbi:Dam family site-specific DNA-(adenine-N6)-methyltransferase [Candidatus Saccharibacteria bacterium]|nr:Dam family site-specific DNA-(adenine-N6)-methyltransferase [Candidatus Saccharibacteria bacterium]
MAKPFLKWVGGKTQLLGQFADILPPQTKIKKYYEPFVGGGAVFFYLEPAEAVINDLNSHLIYLYRHVKSSLQELIDELEIIQSQYLPLNHEERKNYYYEARIKYNKIKTDDSVTKSALLIFLNKTCFNGMYRENPKGEYNIPFGRNNTVAIFDPAILENASRVLQQTKIMYGSYKNSLRSAGNGDFVYLDPPYVPLNNTTANFTQYVSEDFNTRQHDKLKIIFDELEKRGCKVMLSNSDTKLVRSKYKEYNITPVYANRFVNCKPGGRGKISELVITNY